MIKTYSNKRDGNKQLSPHFKVREFAEQCNDEIKIDDRLLPLLEAIYAALDCTKIIITSGYRTAAHNRAVGGAVYSQHQYGRAADIRVSGVPVEQLAAYAETLLPGTGGIGRYPAKGFVHVDVRKAKSRWVG